MRLIKINAGHYIVVDDFDIYKDDFVYYKSVNKSLNPPKNGIYRVEKITDKIIQFYNNEGVVDISSCKKITYSTQPLEIETIPDEKFPKVFDKIKLLSLSEVEEAIYGYSVEKMVEHHRNKLKSSVENPFECKKSYIEGFNAHKELVKDKLFTIDDVIKISQAAFTVKSNNETLIDDFDKWFNKRIQSMLPKTEWNIEFDEHGKLKLI